MQANNLSRLMVRIKLLCLILLFLWANYSFLARASATEEVQPSKSVRFIPDEMCPAKPSGDAFAIDLPNEQLKEYANSAFWNDMYCQARDAIAELMKRSKCSEKKPTHECFELGMNYAICDLQEGRAKDAYQRLAKLYPTVIGGSSNSGMDDPDCCFYLAECDYRQGKYKDAIVLYRNALTNYRKALPKLSPDLAPALEGLAGCYYRKKDYQEVEPLYKELARIDLISRGHNDLRYAWSLMNLSDVEHKLGHDDDRRVFFEAAVSVFREVNQHRIVDELEKSDDRADNNNDHLEVLESSLESSIFGKSNKLDQSVSSSNAIKLLDDGVCFKNSTASAKRPFDFYNWRFKRSQKSEAPGFVIVDPEVPLKGLIICVHGLGLHHKSYTDFGNKMSKLGYGIISFDMRGFGQYQDEKGYDMLDLDACVEDLSEIVKLFKRDYPTTPLFLLGESMGGAVALHVSAKCENDLDGLISSVPSGSRYKAKKTTFEVALKLLKGRDRQFNIGSKVIEQATHDEVLRKQWRDDPEVRLNLSATELVKFQHFMNQNEKLAKELKTLPVIIFQGFGDKLVKPEGTLALYNAMGTKFKNLVLIGHQEHLIFEEGQCPPEVLDGLIGWLNNHRNKKNLPNQNKLSKDRQ
ncbi:MAG: alpha/beta fold hydrolase [Candidatus Obscuribacterales bacterium]|nr:alpha/beta fold hydrolase [Candidatus Obscuribacterales bacterium]